MKENEQIRKYNIRFNTLACSTSWDTNALKWAYQRGLASRIKDEMARLPEPRTLAEYRQEVARIDNRYWRREEEKKREAGRNPGTSNKGTNQSKKGTGNSSVQTTTTVSTSTSSNSQPKSSGSNKSSGKQSGNSKGSGSGSSKSKRPYEKHLGPDGKLKPEELERRKKEGLCTFCGGKHKIEDCDKRKQSNQSRGRAANLESSSELPAIAEVPEN